jgi:hypothetical protein
MGRRSYPVCIIAALRSFPCLDSLIIADPAANREEIYKTKHFQTVSTDTEFNPEMWDS